MLNWYKNRAIIFFGCALVGMLLLAASVSQILYTPENFISSSQESGLPLRSVDRIVFRGQERLMVLFYILLILALLSILLTPEGRRRLVFFLGILALLFIFTSAPKNTAETIATQMPSVTSAPTQAIEENAFIPQPVV